MTEALAVVDRWLLHVCNVTIANPVLDVLMPFLTTLDRQWYGRLLFALPILLLMVFGGRKGRIVSFFLLLLVAFSDQLSSTVIKNLVQRPRPCHQIDGMKAVEGIRLLVDCGSGYSFPSSHAVNYVGVATYFSYYYRRWTWGFMMFGFLMALTRPYVGVHYPSDLLGGAAIGALCAAAIILAQNLLARRFPLLALHATNEHHPTA